MSFIVFAFIALTSILWQGERYWSVLRNGNSDPWITLERLRRTVTIGKIYPPLIGVKEQYYRDFDFKIIGGIHFLVNGIFFNPVLGHRIMAIATPV